MSEISEKMIYQAKGGPIAGIINHLKKLENGNAPSFFVSEVIEASGESQDVPHSFENAPSIVIVVPVKILSDECEFVQGNHGSANIKVTATQGAKFQVLAVE